MAVSEWARQAVIDWLPEAERLPYTVITNFAEPVQPHLSSKPLADIVSIGHLESSKNHTYLLDILGLPSERGTG